MKAREISTNHNTRTAEVIIVLMTRPVDDTIIWLIIYRLFTHYHIPRLCMYVCKEFFSYNSRVFSTKHYTVRTNHITKLLFPSQVIEHLTSFFLSIFYSISAHIFGELLFKIRISIPVKSIQQCKKAIFGQKMYQYSQNIRFLEDIPRQKVRFYTLEMYNAYLLA